MQSELFCDTCLDAASPAELPAGAQVDGVAVHEGADAVLEMVFVGRILAAVVFERVDGLVAGAAQCRLYTVGVFALLMYVETRYGYADVNGHGCEGLIVVCLRG